MGRPHPWFARRSSPTELHSHLLWGALVGLVGALATVAFREGIRAAEWLFTRHTGGLVEAAHGLPGWMRVLVPAAGGLMAGLVLQYGMRLARSGGATTDYMQAVAVGDGVVGIRGSLVKSVSSLLTIGSGGPIGREGAMVQLAAMLGSAVGRAIRCPPPHLRLLVACGAAAGIASAYNAPISGALFVAEIVLGSIALESIGPLIVASVVANATVHQFLGYEPVYRVPAFVMESSGELPLYLLLGVIAGHLGPSFLAVLEGAEALFGRLMFPVFLKLSLGGLVVGAISVDHPDVWGNGYSVVNSVLHTDWLWSSLIVLLLLKVLATAATVGSGAVGGVFTPTLFVGAVLGSLFGLGCQWLLPEWTSHSSAYTIIGMGAFLAATTHAPLMSILMVFEMTLQYQVVLPLMLACVSAHYVAKVYRRGESVYARSLHGRLPGLASPATGLMALARPTGATIADDASAAEVHSALAQQGGEPVCVIDGAGRFIGAISHWPAPLDEHARAADLVEPDHPVLTVGLGLVEALDAFIVWQGDRLPLIDTQYRLVGTVSRSDLLRAVRDRLVQRTGSDSC